MALAMTMAGLAACGGRPTPRAAEPSRPASKGPDPGAAPADDVSREVAALTKRIAELHGRPFRRPVRVVVEGVGFAEGLAAKDRELGAAAPGSEAYFVASDDTVHVRSGARARPRRATLARMLAVAYRRQEHPSMFARAASLPFDQRIAFESLVRGETELVGTIVDEEAAGRDPTAEIARFTAEPHDPMRGPGAVPADLPEEVRRAEGFAFVLGLDFAYRLWQSGGFALLDRAWAAPHLTSRAVLFPDQALEGLTTSEPVVPALGLDAERAEIDRLGALELLVELRTWGVGFPEVRDLVAHHRGGLVVRIQLAKARESVGQLYAFDQDDAASAARLARAIAGVPRSEGMTLTAEAKAGRVIATLCRTADVGKLAPAGRRLMESPSEGRVDHPPLR